MGTSRARPTLALRNDSRSNTPISTPPSTTASDHNAPLLGRDAQTLIECNQKLKELGIDETITLPQICVIGDQSTGKSSLIEALSTVQVPKAAGCCTQCPIAINLSSGANKDSPWTCTVYIEQRYDYVEQIGRKKAADKKSLGPWQERAEINIEKLQTTNDKNKVAHLIRVAQAAVLDPNRNAAYYLSSPEAVEDAPQVARFSPNVIRLDISEGDWPNLSFIDLPGVIANTGHPKDRYLVDLIRSLVTKYARDQRSVNMLTLPMTHDVANSMACGILQQLHVEDRTLAVFTKPDLADDAQRNQFLKEYLGKADALHFEHGYHIVMMPDNLSHEQARDTESSFFKQQPWSSLPPGHVERLGIPALSNYLRRLLFEKTAETLPGNLKAIEARLAVVEGQLRDLPTPLDQTVLPFKLTQDLVKFESGIAELFSAAATRRAWNEKAATFRNLVVNSKPTLMLSTRAEIKAMAAAERRIKGEAIEVASEDEAPTTPIKTETQGLIARTVKRVDPVHRFRLEDIRNINNDFYSAFHMGEIDPKAVDHMNKLSVQGWSKLLVDHMEACRTLLREQILQKSDNVFAKLAHLEVHAIINTFLRGYISAATQAEWTLAEEVCRREQTRPFTLDCDTLNLKAEHCLAERRRKRAESRCKLLNAQLNAERGAPRSKREEAKETDLEPDPFDREVQMSAKTRAYYEIASCRFTDIICQSIYYNLLPKCGQLLVNALREHLGVDDESKHATIISWMAEDKEREALRRRLLHEKQKLVEGHSYIKGVLGHRDPSPIKRRPSKTPSVEESSESPAKRTKFDHAGNVVDLSEEMQGVEEN